MHAVPSARRSRYGRGVVDGGAGKQAKALVGQPEHTAERWKHERRDNVKQEDDRNSLGNLAIVGIDDGRGSGDGRTAANRRTHTHKRRDLTRHVHNAAEHKGDDKRGRDRRHDNRQRLGTLGQNLGEVHAKAKQDNRVLQDFFGRIGDAGGELCAAILGKDDRQNHAEEDGEYRPTDTSICLPSSVAGIAMIRQNKTPFQRSRTIFASCIWDSFFLFHVCDGL